jgi:pimeloyl-ACP methyl ester carboxylesterase
MGLLTDTTAAGCEVADSASVTAATWWDRRRPPAQAEETHMSVPTATSESATPIRPFTIPVTPEAELEALRARIAATRWPDQELVADHSQGVQLAVIQELARYWATEYDWRRCEAKLNALPHFMTEIDGLDIHFIHLRSEHENALPLIVTHGWPGSVIELLKIIDPLTNPTAHGAGAADAFDVVIPSMPGYGYSGKPRETGWGPARMARAWVELMKRLGYTRFVAQGGDWGAVVTDVMAAQAPPELLGIHSNMPGVVPPEVSQAIRFVTGAPAPAGLSADEQRAWEQLNFLYSAGIGYAAEMGTQPQTLYALADSPIGLAAWMINHDAASYQDIADAFAGHPVGDLTRDAVLDNVTFYWLTNTAVSSGRLYWESKLGFFDAKNVSIPAAVTVFPHEIYQAPRSWAERAYPGLMYFNEVDRGNHFAAWQEPTLFTDEVRAGFRSLR